MLRGLPHQLVDGGQLVDSSSMDLVHRGEDRTVGRRRLQLAPAQEKEGRGERPAGRQEASQPRPRPPCGLTRLSVMVWGLLEGFPQPHGRARAAPQPPCAVLPTAEPCWHLLPLQELLLLLPVGVHQLLRDQLHQLQALLYLHQDLEVLPAPHLENGTSPGLTWPPSSWTLFPPSHAGTVSPQPGTTLGPTTPTRRYLQMFMSSSSLCLTPRAGTWQTCSPILPEAASRRGFPQRQLLPPAAPRHLQAHNTSPPPRVSVS